MRGPLRPDLFHDASWLVAIVTVARLMFTAGPQPSGSRYQSEDSQLMATWHDVHLDVTRDLH